MRRAILVLALVGTSVTARATDNKNNAITVIPWTDATVSFAPDNQSATLQYVQLLGGVGGNLAPQGIQLYVKATAPLDQDTRVAAFVNKGRLVAPFSFEVQFGFDQRAGRLQVLRDEFQQIDRLAKALSKVPSVSANGWQAEYCRNNHERLGFEAAECNETTLLTAWCKAAGGASCDSEHLLETVEQAQCATRFGAPCGATTPEERTQAFLDRALAYLKTNCATSTSRQGPACFETAFMIAAVDRQRGALQLFKDLDAVLKNTTIEQLWAQLKGYLDDSVAKQIESDAEQRRVPLSQVVFEHSSDLASALDTALQQNILMRRDLLLVGTDPGQPRNLYSLVFDGSLAYDRLTVYQDDLASQPQQNDKYDIQLGVNGTVYFKQPGTSLNLRVGWEGTQDPGATQVQRCETTPSTSMTISGQACDSNALFRTGPRPGMTNSAYLRAALDYQFLNGKRNTKIIPGFELRAGLEGLGAAKSMDWRLVLYGTPTTGSAAARVGVGVDLRWAIDDGAEGTMRRGDVAFVPFAVFGATATSLMGR